ncbi:MAG: SdrD B-like domain-containing protein [Candidatus Omnitrophica bacterium]|nr:SdrD B-like domain-containing protein [Candidatus Omnitrophota bacterium]MDD5573933.1 SdrD B-like domain-containing protein [Candidatus Omnitrophota bacterium]
MLIQKGISYFDGDRYPEALVEFKKALLANPESEIARVYIDMIERETAGWSGEAVLPQEGREALVDLYLTKMEPRSLPYPADEAAQAFDRGAPHISKQPIEKSQEAADNLKSPAVKKEAVKVPALPASVSKGSDESSGPAVLDLASYEDAEIRLYMREPLVLQGIAVRRFLVTHPAILKAGQVSDTQVLLEPQEIGQCYLHLWDKDNRRRSYKVMIGPQRFEEIYAQELKKRLYEASLPESFKFTYSISGDTFLTGRGVGDIQRESHTMAYSSSLRGETPYGKFDASVQGNRTTQKNYRISNLRMGLTDAHYDQFKDINIRWFDYSSSFASFGFPVSELRGIKVDAPMFEKTVNYSAFWGALPEGDFSFLTADSGLSKTKKAWLEGLGVSFQPTKFASFKTFYAHSYGSERIEPVLTSDMTGFEMDYDFGAWNFGSGMVTDMTHISYTADTSVTIPRLRIGLNMTDNAKNFASLLGGVPTTGSTSGTLSINYRPTDSVTIYNAVSGTHDKVFNNPEDPARPNYNATTRLNWILDPHTEIELGYIMDDQIGSNTPAVTETKEIMFRKKLFFLRRLNTFLLYQNRKSKNYTSPVQNFNNNRLLGGVNFRLLYDIYFYYNQEVNMLRNTFTNETAYPTASEFGLHYNHQISNTPFYTNLRLFYRNEQDTESTLSFLSGEDRLEGEAELTFKPSQGNETFVKLRIDNIWAERTGVEKHFDVSLSWGVRLLWDTGLRWQSVGGFSGFVFYDINGDGVKQTGEAGVPGVKIAANGQKEAVTDKGGFYRISGVSGKKADLAINLATVPQGYNATVPPERTVDIVHAKTKRYDFGLATRMEISGIVFHDKNKNGVYDSGEETLKGVVLLLDGKTKAVTNLQGTYMFRQFAPGEHAITLDLKTLPVAYIPKVPVRKTISVREGSTFVYNIPLELQKTPAASPGHLPQDQEKSNVTATFVR